MGMQFSAEELAVLQQCDMEALVQRSIPIGTLCGVGTWMAIQRGFLSAHKTFGAGPKGKFLIDIPLNDIQIYFFVVLGAVVFGYFVGKISYQNKCAEKIMRLPNSKLAEALRRRRKGEFFENFTSEGGLSLAPFSSATDVYTDENLKEKPQNSLDLDTSRPSQFGLDDTYRPSLDTPERNFHEDPLETPKSSTSYEELRKRNRENYDQRMQAPFSR